MYTLKMIDCNIKFIVESLRDALKDDIIDFKVYYYTD